MSLKGQKNHHPLKAIAKLDLAAFEKPSIPGNPDFVVRAAWYLVNVLIFRSAILGLIPSSVKAVILRLFGAQIGSKVVIKPRVDLKSPWFLTLGNHVWLGERVWIDNHTLVIIGSNSCVSQGAYIFTGNHNWADPKFPFFCKPVLIGDGVWITAFQRLGPGTTVPSHTVV